LVVKFENGEKKNDGKPSYKIYLETQKTLFILLNPYFLKELVRTFKSLAEQFRPEDFKFYLD